MHIIFNVHPHLCYLGRVRVINARETVPKAFKTDLLAMCPTTIQPMEGDSEPCMKLFLKKILKYVNIYI